MSNERGSFRGGALVTPSDSPLEDNQDAHISESAEEKYLLWKPLKEKVNIVLEVQRV